MIDYYSKLEKLPLLISFSGGRSSAMMAKLLINKWKGKRAIHVVFANTSREHEATLQFVKNCDDIFGFGTAWIEAVANHGARKSPDFRTVDFWSAKRKGEVWIDLLKKHGTPNVNRPHCTRDLKVRPINKYMKQLYGKGGYAQALGMRGEEESRISISESKKSDGYYYPLVSEIPVFSEQDVLDFWKKQPFDLQLENGGEFPKRLGNCIDCHKKSDKRLFQNYQDDRAFFDFQKYADQEYGMIKSKNGEPYNRWRADRTTIEMIEDAEDWIEQGIETEHINTNAKCSC